MNTVEGASCSTECNRCVRRMFVVGAIMMALAVGLGAFGAHGLKAHTDAYGLAVWETAVRYHAWHALGLMILAVVGRGGGGLHLTGKPFKISGACLLLGTLIFSGSLYLLVLSGQKWLGAITPIGGVLFIVGWLTAAFSLVR